ncbi:hypothetical protein [Actinokineospora globicatena]|uniref:hypothetical protein n=1 Tax=Actinokineospora globicatena TaxID=103729 RepID=UPI0020A282D5|nr:hypothetical protein [Actinokineospora globicatena]MCP2306607.1 hypothetical protein [Actinokineospora globicatena]GLW82041.1 hypothetical protein Aglo01_65220 [Actinokineospora globicatena]GLW88835.1 hypothetical protein Aglo02_64740 [Actinokineospora globicatena]
MRSGVLKMLAVAGAVATGLALVPATSSAAGSGGTTAMASQGHVNSNVDFTWLYIGPTGDSHYNVKLGACTNFWYDAVDNGRYHDISHGGWVSTDKAGPGWC